MRSELYDLDGRPTLLSEIRYRLRPLRRGPRDAPGLFWSLAIARRWERRIKGRPHRSVPFFPRVRLVTPPFAQHVLRWPAPFLSGHSTVWRCSFSCVIPQQYSLPPSSSSSFSGLF